VIIVHEGADYAVVEKPSGLLSVPGKGADKADCVVARVRRMLPRAAGPMVVHRLDMETSGLLVVGLTAAAQRDLSGQFEARRVRKGYAALLAGEVAEDSGEVSLPLRPDLLRRPFQIVDAVHGRAAVTRYRVVARETDRTRVEFEPVTGRSHQLRVHAATMRAAGGLGCPIIGDVLYGDASTGERLMLHATRLAFTEPGTGRGVEFESAVPF